MKITKARLKEIIREELQKVLVETGADDTGASKGDDGKDPDDPDAKDYTDGGDREGDESKQDRRYVDFKDDEGTTITGGAKK